MVELLSFGILASAVSTGGSAVGTFTRYANVSSTEDFTRMAWGGGQAGFIDSGGTASGYASDPTSSITSGSAVTNVSGARLDYFDGAFYATGGTDVHRIMRSTDGINWTAVLNVTAQTGDTIYGVAYNGSVFIAPVAGDNDVYTSANGTAWTLQSGVLGGTARTWTSPTWNGTVFGVYESAGTNYYTSTDGTTWTARTLSAAPAASPRNPVMGDDRLLYVTSSEVAYTSTTGTSWTLVGTAPTIANNSNFPTAQKLAYGAGIWTLSGFTSIAGGTAVTFYSANNGTTWATATMGASASFGGFDLTYNNNAFFYVIDTGTATDIYKASVS